MPELRILTIHDPEDLKVLRTRGRKVQAVTPRLVALAEEMLETMREANGVGLAAPQVGVSLRFFVAELPEDEETGEPCETFILFNPEIVKGRGEQVGYEGCLSIPGTIGEVARKDEVTETLVRGVEELVRAQGVDVYPGVGQLVAPGRVQVTPLPGSEQAEVTLEGRKVILATGSDAAQVPIPGVDLPGVVTSRELLRLTEQPKAMVVIGIFSSLMTLVFYNRSFPYMLLISSIIGAPQAAGYWTITASMKADICDDDELKHGMRREGMFGAIAKTYYAEKIGVDPKDIFSVSVMPCTAKKFEASRHDHTAVEGLADIDVALTTRELGRMIQRAGIRFTELPDAEFDSPFGLGSGAGTIFGATGGVMEAALRTAAEIVTGKPLEKLEFNDVRGVAGIKEATYELAGNVIKVAVASGLENADRLLRMVKSGEKYYDFIEIMACPGGCVNGGGQPIVPASVRNFVDVRAVRAAALYQDDLNLPVRKSHENPDIKSIYAEYFEKPGSHKAHEILHTAYTKRPKY